MDIQIKRLSPESAEDYLNFFDVTPHSDGEAEHRCYCVCWAGEDCDGQDFSTDGKRRELAAAYVKRGAIQGYLAYVNDMPAGWCNANTKADCYNSMAWKMFMQNIKKDSPDVKVKSVFCFTVAPEVRRKGIAAQLLRRVCEDAAADGFDCVEAYPNKEFVSTEEDFMGTVGMYMKAGFRSCYEADNRLVMRKELK